MIRSLWVFRYFIVSSIKGDLVNRFVRSKLGLLWIILNPLAQAAIYAAVLSNIMVARLPDFEHKYAYAVYLLSGLLAWNLFYEIINRCLGLFIEFGNLIKKVQFPRVALPAIVLGSNLVSNFMLLIAIMCVFLLLGHTFSLKIFWIAPLIILTAGLAVGLGLILGILNVFIRDLGHAVPVFLQLTFWFTPIVYPISIIPPQFRELMDYNPLFYLVTAYQDVLLYNKTPNTDLLFVLMPMSLVVILFSLLFFRRVSSEILDSL